MIEAELPFVRGARLDHVAIAVPDAADAARLFRDVLIKGLAKP